MTAFASFAFVRHVDRLRHPCERADERHGRPAYRRTDGRVWCLWTPTDGRHREIPDGLVLPSPLTGHDDGPEPPATVWRSFRNDRPYLNGVRPASLESDA